MASIGERLDVYELKTFQAFRVFESVGGTRVQNTLELKASPTSNVSLLSGFVRLHPARDIEPAPGTRHIEPRVLL